MFKRFASFLWKWKVIILILMFLAAGLPFYINSLVVREGMAQVASSPNEAVLSEAAIVLGARVYKDGKVSPVLVDRLDTGIELYKAGKVKKLLLSGDHGQTSYDEVNAMREYVLARGIPPQDVFMDHAGFSTYETMYRARDIFGIKEAIVVTQKFHLARALYIARELGLKVSGASADRRPYVGLDYMENREFLARNKAFVQLHILHSKPQYLGPAIPISGDGRSTWDRI